MNKTNAQDHWVRPHGKNVQTIYFQGIFASHAQISKYTGTRGFVALTGEKVVYHQAPDIVCCPYSGKELDEVDLAPLGQEKQDSRLIAYLAKLCFPASTIQKLVSLSKNNRWGMTAQGSTIGKTSTSFSIDWRKCDFGQEGDVAEHKKKYDQCVHEYPDDDIILFGASRGAAATFNAAALNGYDMRKVKFIMLESCYDSLPSVLHEWYPRLRSGFLNSTLQRLLSVVTGYRVGGISPIALVDAFPEDVPVVFITSSIDTTVPKNCTNHCKKKHV